jgi:hypothetical protein
MIADVMPVAAAVVHMVDAAGGLVPFDLFAPFNAAMILFWCSSKTFCSHVGSLSDFLGLGLPLIFAVPNALASSGRSSEHGSSPSL